MAETKPKTALQFVFSKKNCFFIFIVSCLIGMLQYAAWVESEDINEANINTIFSGLFLCILVGSLIYDYAIYYREKMDQLLVKPVVKLSSERIGCE
jgi:hypothetical protein